MTSRGLEAALRYLDVVAEALDGLAVKGGLLDPKRHGSTVRYGGQMPSAHRAGVLATVVDEYLDVSGREVIREHRAALMTAGPPGAGKSTAMGSGFAGYRQIDADEVKDLLLRRSLEDGDYEAQLAQVLPDGHPVMPREISQLFHEEAWRVAHQVRRVALRRGENVVLQGTLAWRPFAEGLVDDLSRADYETLTILAVDVDVHTAHDRAMNRWWSGRQDAIAGRDPLGGRYLNVKLIADAYWTPVGDPICTANARWAAEYARHRTGLQVELREGHPQVLIIAFSSNADDPISTAETI